MTRRTAIQLIGGAASAAAAEKPSGPRWTLQYFYDRNRETFNINDFQFNSPTHGIAVGWVADRNGKNKPMSAITSDGGAHWEIQPLPDLGLSMFFLNDSLGWLVGDKAIWRTEEGGRDWKKLKIPKDTDINRVYFRDPDHGWAACQRKRVLETKDGGRTWTDLAVAGSVTANPEYSSYNWIDFVDKKNGVIVGSSIPPRPGEDRPAWMDPEGASKRREWPSLTITLETQDGGVTWRPQTVPAFGQTVRLRLTQAGSGLILLRFGNGFEWPSEVYLLQPKGGSTRVYREKTRVVTDLGWLTPSRAILAAIEPPGRLAQLPIPGKLHVLQSENMKDWTEMSVDYRAFGTRAMLSVVNPDLAWVATDTGQIFRLTK